MGSGYPHAVDLFSPCLAPVVGMLLGHPQSRVPQTCSGGTPILWSLRPLSGG